MSEAISAAAWLAVVILVAHTAATIAGGKWEAVRRRTAIAMLPLLLFITVFGAGIAVTAALLAAFCAGYGFRAEREQAKEERP